MADEQYIYMEELLKTLGCSSNVQEHEERIKEAQAWYRETQVQPGTAFRALLDGLHEQSNNLAWFRLFAGEKNLQENRRVPLRLHKLAELLDDDVHEGGNVKIRKVFDVDTISVVTNRLDVFNTTENHPELKMQYKYCKSDNMRGRVLMKVPDDEEIYLPALETRIGAVSEKMRLDKSAYVTKKYLGSIPSNRSCPLYVAQMHCDLGNDSDKWAAWEMCYRFIVECLHAGSHFNAPDPRSSSGRGRSYTRSDATIQRSTSSRANNQMFMDYLQSHEFRQASFDGGINDVLRKIKERAGNFHDKYGLLPSEFPEMDSGVMAGDDGEEHTDEEVIAEQREAYLYIDMTAEAGGSRNSTVGEQLVFNRDSIRELFTNMMDNLWFIGTIQIARTGIGEIRVPLGEQHQDREAALEPLKLEAMSTISKYINMSKVADSTVAIFPNIGMELTLTQEYTDESGEPSSTLYRKLSELHPLPQHIRLHLDRRAINEEKQEFLRRNPGRPQWEIESAWGNMSNFDGPCGLRARVAPGPNGDFESPHGMMQLLAPIDTDVFSEQSPLLIGYETTIRGLPGDSILRQGQAELLKDFELLCDPNRDAQSKINVLRNICDVMTQGVGDFFRSTPSPTPLRLEDVSCCAVSLTPDEYVEDDPPSNRLMRSIERMIGKRLRLLDGINIETLVGYSCHDDYKYLTEGLLAWMRLLEIQGTRRLEAKLSLPSFFIDTLALSIGTVCFTAGGTRKEDFETAKMINYLLSRSGMAITDSMGRNGYATVPRALATASANEQTERIGVDTLKHLLTTEKHSFVTQNYLRQIISQITRWNRRSPARWHAYQSQVCFDVFSITRPTLYPIVLMDYYGMVFLTYLVRNLPFRLEVFLKRSKNKAHGFQDYRIMKLEYVDTNHGKVWDDQDLHDILGFAPGSCASIFGYTIFNNIVDLIKHQVEAGRSKVQFPRTARRVENLGEFIESAVANILRRAGTRKGERHAARNAKDKTLYMHIMRALVLQMKNTFGVRGETLCFARTKTLLTSVLTYILCVNHLNYWSEFGRDEEDNLSLKLYTLIYDTCNRQGMIKSSINNLKQLDKAFRATLFFSLGAGVAVDEEDPTVKRVSSLLDDIALSWQRRHIANTFAMLAKELRGENKILVFEEDVNRARVMQRLLERESLDDIDEIPFQDLPKQKIQFGVRIRPRVQRVFGRNNGRRRRRGRTGRASPISGLSSEQDQDEVLDTGRSDEEDGGGLQDQEDHQEASPPAARRGTRPRNLQRQSLSEEDLAALESVESPGAESPLEEDDDEEYQAPGEELEWSDEEDDGGQGLQDQEDHQEASPPAARRGTRPRNLQRQSLSEEDLAAVDDLIFSEARGKNNGISISEQNISEIGQERKNRKRKERKERRKRRGRRKRMAKMQPNAGT